MCTTQYGFKILHWTEIPAAGLPGAVNKSETYSNEQVRVSVKKVPEKCFNTFKPTSTFAF